MYDVQTIEVSIIIIVILSLNLIWILFHIDIFVIFLYIFEHFNFVIFVCISLPTVLTRNFDSINLNEWMNEWIISSEIPKYFQ